ncbi:beta-ketoacyl-ACP synthase II [Proteocatella sphenisci]|uniref:beta-ketoacyl-ACP synthase II n=1 Tax=Proteocatella sphenisci TaxID=181070 RepID=UPI00048F186D|nr:beta-ketoacyl-ACP synthase II [Proteocatella sphenisci]
MKRVVITGLGAVSPVGNDIESTWESLKAGKNGIDKITLFDPSRSKVSLVAEVKNFDYSKYIDPKSAKRMDRFTQFIVCAAKMAFEDSMLNDTNFDKSDARVVIGSGIGGLGTIQEQIEKLTLKGPGKVSPFFIPASIVNIAPAHVSMELGLQGPSTAIVTACASGTDAVGDAFRSIRDGYHEIAIAGGCEAAITESGIAGFANMTALHTGEDKNRASIPFDKDRSGFVMGEGGGALVLEELDHALARNAKIYAEITGYGQSCDAYHITSPDPEGKGAIKAMQRAISDAGITPDKIDYINAHGTSTPYNDKFETQAIKAVFGDHSSKLLISSTKSMTGHLLGAAGAIEAIACVKALEEGIVPPTINLQNPDPECDLNYVADFKIESDIKYTLSNSLGFGGHNATIIMKKWENK